MLQDNLLPSGQRSQEGFSISLDRVDRHQAGVYQCTASNGVGNPVTVDMQLDILCESLTAIFTVFHFRAIVIVAMAMDLL